MRIRSIKPEFWRSSSISCLAIEDRLLFVGLWSYVDDNGVGKDKLSAVAADLFADDLERDASETFARVSRGLARLTEAGRLVRYRVAGEPFMRVVNWSEHQRIDKPGKARYPSDDAENAVIRESVASVPVKVAPGAGEQGSRGTEEQGNSSSVQPTVEPDSGFDDFWSVYPRKQGKQAAKRKYLVVRKKVSAEVLLEAARAYALMSLGKDRELIKMCAGWLADGRYEDTYDAAPSVAIPPRKEEQECLIHSGYPLPCYRCGEAEF